MFHYDAFISYNHNPRDNKITRLIQQKLENYKLPKGVTVSSGREKIERVFLDKGELEVAGDLNEIIEDALENSDYLIVICSPESKASIWVQREIEFFLKNHPVDKILTVITDGEPFDVLPDRILYEDIDDGSGNTVRKSREPLSCDFRLPLRKAEKEELPRLIAAILGCRYDDLVQRQRQYRMRRQIALLAAAAVLLTSATSYLIWSNHRIRANYNQSLREESLNLAVQSEQALARGDRLGAIRYALDALPSKGKERPVVSDAVLALSEALDLYHSSQEKKWTAVRQFPSDESCYQEVPFTVNKQEYIAARYASGRVMIWKADSADEVMPEYTEELFSSGIEIEQIEITKGKTLLMMSAHKLFSLDVSSEKENYSLELSLPSDKSAEVSRYSRFCCNDDQLWVTVSGPDDNRLLQIDLKTGKAVKDITAGEDYPEDLDLSPDGKSLAFVHEIDDFTGSELELIDTASGDRKTLKRPYITDIGFDNGGRLIMCGMYERPSEYDYSTVISSDYIRLGRDYSYRFTEYKQRKQFVTCLAPSDLSEEWTMDRSGLFCGKPWLQFAPASDKRSGRYRDAFACVSGSNVIMCSKDGKVIDDIEFHSPALLCRFDDERVRTLLRNGTFGAYNTSDKAMYAYENVFAGDIRSAATDEDASSGSIYIRSDNVSQDDKTVLTQYVYNGTDPDWTGFEDDTVYDNATFSRGWEQDEDRFVEIRSAGDPSSDDDRRIARIISRRSGNGEIVSDNTISVPEEVDEYTSFAYAGYDEEHGKLYFADEIDNSTLIEHDIASGETSFISLSPETDDYINYFNWYGDRPIGEFVDGSLYIPVNHSSYLTDPATGEWFDIDGIDIEVIDVGTGDYTFIPVITHFNGDAPEITGSAMDAKKELLFVADSSNVISSYSFDGTLNWQSEPLPSMPQSLCITDDGHLLILVQTDPSVYELQVLRTSDGKEEAATGIGFLRNASTASFYNSSYDTLSSGEALMGWNSYAFVLSTDDWSLRNRISAFLTYHADSGSMILGDPAEESMKVDIGRVPYRTLEEIIAEGQAVIGK